MKDKLTLIILALLIWEIDQLIKRTNSHRNFMTIQQQLNKLEFVHSEYLESFLDDHEKRLVEIEKKRR